MTDSAQRWVEQLRDPVSRPAARAELLRLGAASVEPLITAFEAADGEPREEILRLLVELHDPRAAGVFRGAVQSGQERLRALGARGLFELRAPDAVEAAVAAINDTPDRLHFEITPAVRSLGEIGLPAAAAVLPLLESADERTRQRAQKVLEIVTRKQVRGTTPSRPLSQEADAAWSALWRENGSYDWKAPEPERRASVERWRRWMERL